MFQVMGKGTLDRPENALDARVWYGNTYCLFLFVPDLVNNEVSDVGNFYAVDPNPELPEDWQAFVKPPGTTEAQWASSAYVATITGLYKCRVTKPKFDMLKFSVRGKRGKGNCTLVTHVGALLTQPSEVY